MATWMFPLRGSFKGDIDTDVDMDIDMDMDMDIDSDMVVSTSWGVLFFGVLTCGIL